MTKTNRSIKELENIANKLRIEVLKMLEQAGTGHTASPLGLAEFFSAMYWSILKHNPKKPNWNQRDRLIVSCGHVVPIRYAALALSGYFARSELSTLRKLGTRLQGHPSVLDLPELESSSGPLGQGTSIAVGTALAAKKQKLDHYIYLLMSDGEQQEGQTWEAALAAHKFELGNLIAFLDHNEIQISGQIEDIMPLQSLSAKYASFGWHVQEVNGHNIHELIKATKIARLTQHQPSVIIMRTCPGKGVDFMENKYEWHGKAPDSSQLKSALRQLKKTNIDKK